MKIFTRIPFKKAIVVFAFAFAFVGIGGALFSPSHAVDVFDACNGSGTQAVCQNRDNELLGGDDSLWARILRIVTIVTGAISGLMVVVGGLRYTLSQGDSSATKSAKDTILYAMIGLVISIVAGTIITFVTSNI